MRVLLQKQGINDAELISELNLAVTEESERNAKLGFGRGKAKISEVQVTPPEKGKAKVQKKEEPSLTETLLAEIKSLGSDVANLRENWNKNQAQGSLQEKPQRYRGPMCWKPGKLSTVAVEVQPVAEHQFDSSHCCRTCRRDVREEKLLHCGSCKAVSYCSKSYQMRDWGEHKPFALQFESSLRDTIGTIILRVKIHIFTLQISPRKSKRILQN